MRRILSLVVVALVMAAMVLVVAMPALTDAKDENADGAKCSEATLDGRYLFGYDGFVIKGNDKVPFAIAGYEVYDGNGHVKGVATTNENGKVTRNEPFSGTYTVKADCTGDRKSTRLNSSHANISYAVFCLKKKQYTHSLLSTPHLLYI